MPTVSNLELKALEVVSTLKQKFSIVNQKKLKLTKNPDCAPFRKKVDKALFHFLQNHFFIFREKA